MLTKDFFSEKILKNVETNFFLWCTSNSNHGRCWHKKALKILIFLSKCLSYGWDWLRFDHSTKKNLSSNWISFDLSSFSWTWSLVSRLFTCLENCSANLRKLGRKTYWYCYLFSTELPLNNVICGSLFWEDTQGKTSCKLSHWSL